MSPRSIGVTPWIAAAVIEVAALGLLVPAASADPFGYTLTQTDLARVDLVTAVVEPIGPTGFPGLRHIAFHADGTLYGLTEVGPGPLQLLTLDPETGAGQQVAELEHGLPGFEVAGFTGVADGTFLAAGHYPIGGGELQAVVFSIDSGGSVGEPVELSGTPLAQLATCGDQVLLNRGNDTDLLDPVTGETSEFLPRAPAAEAMDVGSDGGLYGLYFSTIVTIPPPVLSIDRLDLVTGRFGVAGAAPNFGQGLAIAPPVPGPCFALIPPAVPTLSPAALVALAIALALAAFVLLQRGRLAPR